MGLDPNSGTYQYKDFNNGSICLCNSDGKVISDSEADADSTRKIVFGSNGGGISSKGEIWTGVSRTLGNVESQLTEALDVIKNHWHGDAADQAYAQLSKLRDTANSLSANSGRMGSGLQMMGRAISDTQANYPDINDDNAAAAWASLKNGTNDGLSRLPTYVEGDVPKSSYDSYRGPGPGSGPGPSLGPSLGPGPGIGPGPSVGPGPSIGPNIGPNTDGPDYGPTINGPSVDGPNYGPSVAGPGYGPSVEGPSTIGPSSGPGYTGGSGLGTGGTGTTLASFDGGSGGGFGPGGAGLAGGAGGLTGSGVSLGGGGAGLGGGLSGGLGGGLGGAGSSGAGGALGVAGGPNIGGVGSAAPGMGGGTGRGAMMGPMMGRPGGGGDEDERERSTWLSEDDDLWGISDAAPPVIS